MKRWQAVRLLFPVGDGTFVDEKRLYVRVFGGPCDISVRHKYIRTVNRYGVYETVAVFEPGTHDGVEPPPHDRVYHDAQFRTHYLRKR